MKRVIKASTNSNDRYMRSVLTKINELINSLNATANYTHGLIDDIVGKDFYERLMTAEADLDYYLNGSTSDFDGDEF